MARLSATEARKRIEKEDDLINHRMVWCVASNAFLIAAYAALAVDNGHSKIFFIILSFIGFLFTAICFTSILAAYLAIWEWKSKINAAIKCSSSYRESYSKPLIAWLGSLSSIFSPVIIIHFWGFVLAFPPEKDWKFPLCWYLGSLPFILAVFGSLWFSVMRLMDERATKRCESNYPNS